MDVGPGMGRDTPDLTALEVAIRGTHTSHGAGPAGVAVRLGRLHRPAVGGPRGDSGSMARRGGAAHLTAAEIVGADGWRSGDDRMVLPRPGGPDDAHPMWVDISGPLLRIALVDLGALAASGPAELATICLAVGVANWGRDTGCACGDHHQPGGH